MLLQKLSKESKKKNVCPEKMRKVELDFHNETYTFDFNFLINKIYDIPPGSSLSGFTRKF